MITIQGDASNVNLTAQKRLLRVVEGQTQATPYAGYLDPSLRNADGTIRIPKASDTLPLARSADAFTFQGGLAPGTVLVKTTGENFTVHNGDTTAAVEPFGLLGQFVGGNFDGLKSSNEIAAWIGPDSVYDILAPGWDDTGLAAAVAASTAGKAVKLYAGKDGRLVYLSSPGSSIAVATVVERASAAVLRIKLLV